MTNPDDEKNSAKMKMTPGGNTLEGGNNSVADDLSLEDLKAFILSIEWEISDEIMTQFIDEVESLKRGYKGDNVVAIFLKLLAIIGKYIRAKKVASHPDSIKLLNSVFNNLETIVHSSELDSDQKRRLLLREAGKFKNLKEKIALSKTAVFASTAQKNYPSLQPVEKDVPAVEGTRPLLPEGMSKPSSTPEYAITPDNEDLLRELKQIIQAEFKLMKAEIREMLGKP